MWQADAYVDPVVAIDADTRERQDPVEAEPETTRSDAARNQPSWTAVDDMAAPAPETVSTPPVREHDDPTKEFGDSAFIDNLTAGGDSNDSNDSGTTFNLGPAIGLGKLDN